MFLCLYALWRAIHFHSNPSAFPNYYNYISRERCSPHPAAALRYFRTMVFRARDSCQHVLPSTAQVIHPIAVCCRDQSTQPSGNPPQPISSKGGGLLAHHFFPSLCLHILLTFSLMKWSKILYTFDTSQLMVTLVGTCWMLLWPLASGREGGEWCPLALAWSWASHRLH